MRIIFMGTPDFAVASLEALLQAGEEVVAVVTTPDKPAGRGQKIHESAVKKYAIQQGLPVLQPEKLRNPEFITALQSYRADLQVVVAFRMLPEVVWNMPPLGTINVHASLLPQYRGAAPINHAIIQGEAHTGVTTFLLQHQIDTGNILFSQQVEIAQEDTAGILHDKLMAAGAEVLLKTVEAVRNNDIHPVPQAQLETTVLKTAPKIFKEDCQILWDRPTDEVYNQIRGLSPYPAAYTILNDKVLKIFETKKGQSLGETPGTCSSDGKTFLSFATQDGSLLVTSLQLEGKKRMQIEEFLRGYRLD
ncbi:methionyl-tRNA formyltransferase [Sphingobacterium corticibacterium]|uniref:Methionyl-tRNA formyltransferase n=1 Tax=Sphingobacterium corticibacterium TaxID=2484746 RepID=A0A4Q6XN63_9SPHI|nr:methionyl-tRNA formyltransferase [Sphingobacterium corticibacterium]RZF61610.1 methionyl-tRNA formyltransferase [Sphingobacterium corticibacterium]